MWNKWADLSYEKVERVRKFENLIYREGMQASNENVKEKNFTRKKLIVNARFLYETYR